MPKKSNRKRLSDRLFKIGHGNLALVAAFIVIFVGFGSFFVYRSEAAGTACAWTTLSIGMSGQCVADAEQMLHNIGINPGMTYLHFSDVPQLGYDTSAGWHADGIFGSGMQQQVKYYQTYEFGSRSATGKVTPQTWASMCDRNGSRWVYTNAGCSQVVWAF